MESIYRDDGVAERCRILREQAWTKWIASSAARRVYVRRLARTHSATAALLALPVLVAFGVAVVGVGEGGLVFALLGSWGVAIAAYVVSLLGASPILRRKVRSALQPTDDAIADLQRLETRDAEDISREEASELGTKSIGRPMVLASLLLPLTLHLAVWSLLSGASKTSCGEFDYWIASSAVIVGHCHAALAYRCHKFAAALAMEPSHGVVTMKWDSAYWLVVALSAVPGLLALLIGVLVSATGGNLGGVVMAFSCGLAVVVLVGVTGGVFIPFMFRIAGSRFFVERVALSVGE